MKTCCVKQIKQFITLLMCAVLLSISACGGGSGSGSSNGGNQSSTTTPPILDPETQTQTKLSVEDLTGNDLPDLVMMASVMPSSTASDAVFGVSGTLSFSSADFTTKFSAAPFYGSGLRRFPALSISFITHNSKLIPLERNLISTWLQDDSFWDVVIGVGEVWSEPDDQGWQRASFPITLVSRLVGTARNCVATFLYSQTEVSNTYVQCSQETAPVDEFIQTQSSMRALVSTDYQAEFFLNEANIIAAYEQEIANNLPFKDWSEIDSDGSLRSSFNSGVTPTHKQSLAALVIDNEIVLQTPETRHGNYPYVGDMRHGVYSVTKTMMGALSLLYFAQVYGDGIFDALIVDYVPALADHPGWQGVTFSHAINMAVGTTSDDDGPYLGEYIQADSADEGVAVIATFPDDDPEPGEQFAYSSINTFVFSYALQQYVEQRAGLGTNYWDMLDQNVLQVIGVSHFATQRTLESDSSPGIPTLGWGAFPTVDDTAKIALLFSNLGEYDGAQLLHRARTEEALHRTERQGYDTGDGRRYQHAFWLQDIFTGECTIQVPHMIGAGGNYVAILPSGIIVIRYMDHNIYNLTPLVLAAESIRSSCT